MILILATPSLVGCASKKDREQPHPIQVPAGKRDRHQQPLHLRPPGY